jgi:hypothetical protein
MLGKQIEDFIKVEYIDVERVVGMTQAIKYDVSSTPTILLLDNQKVIHRWTNQVPTLSELKECLNARGYNF